MDFSTGDVGTFVVIVTVASVAFAVACAALPFVILFWVWRRVSKGARSIAKSATQAANGGGWPTSSATQWPAANPASWAGSSARPAGGPAGFTSPRSNTSYGSGTAHGSGAAYGSGAASASGGAYGSGAASGFGAAGDTVSQLERLAMLHAQGLLSDAELDVEKARILKNPAS